MANRPAKSVQFLDRRSAVTSHSIPRIGSGLGVGLLAVVGLAAAGAPASPAQLKGLFRVSAGSYFRLREPAGSRSTYFANPQSKDANRTYTPVTGGSDGGLFTQLLQPTPRPAFDARGNSLAARIIRPIDLAGVNLGLATQVIAPSIAVNAGKLSGQLTGLRAERNGHRFDQGSSSVAGTYNATTHAYVLTWSSPISGGRFNGYTGYWHLQGKFTS
jgi:hypothetical protein